MTRIEHARNWIALTIVLLGAGIATAQKDTPEKESPPDVPDAIAVPSGLEPVLFVRASGSQTYGCQADAAGNYSWTLKAPR